MTKDEMQELMEHIFKACQLTREDGQKEYAHDTSNAFRNFEALANDLNISREQVLWVYFKKHSDGVLSYINGHMSQREDVRGRIKDMIVYLCLLWGMVDDNVRPKDRDVKAPQQYNPFEQFIQPGPRNK